MSRKKKIIDEVVVSGVADRGLAVGRDKEGVVYFMPDAIPGDVVKLLRIKKKKGVYHGIVKEYLHYSEDRISATCQHFGICGGCKWQHMLYEKQLEHKSQVVHDAMRRIAKISTSIIAPIKGSEKTFQYRNKMEYSFSTKRWLTDEEIKSGEEILPEPAVGFHRAGAFDKVVNITQCHLQDDTGNKIRNFIRQASLENDWTFYDARNHEGFLRSVYLRNNPTGDWMVNVVFKEKRGQLYKDVLKQLALHFPEITSLYYMINDKRNDSIFDLEAIHVNGNKYLELPLGHLRFKLGPKSFFQTNTFQAKVLFDLVKEFADLKGSENIYDLYSGIGSIGFYLADQAKQIVGIEEIPEAIDDAKLNAELNSIDNAIFYAGDVKEIMTPAFASKHGKADLIITDPPRAGMHKDIITMLLQMEVPRIVYVSCNPSTQARDVLLLKEKYRVEKMQPVDMFPHTHHIENVALLTLKDV